MTCWSEKKKRKKTLKICVCSYTAYIIISIHTCVCTRRTCNDYKQINFIFVLHPKKTDEEIENVYNLGEKKPKRIKRCNRLVFLASFSHFFSSSSARCVFFHTFSLSPGVQMGLKCWQFGNDDVALQSTLTFTARVKCHWMIIFFISVFVLFFLLLSFQNCIRMCDHKEDRQNGISD